MDYVKPVDVASAMIETGRRKLGMSSADCLIRGALAGSILAAATSLAITGTVQTGQPLIGALIFPVGLILIVLLGLDLVTGSFGLLPLPWLEKDASSSTMLTKWGYRLCRQSDRQRGVRRTAGDHADQFRHGRTGGSRSQRSLRSRRPRPSAMRPSAMPD